MRLKGQSPVTVQVPDEQLEDWRIVAQRRGQTLSEFIRRATDQEVEQEAMIQVP